MKRITVIPLLFAAALLASCVSAQRDLTYQQRLYAVQSEYIIVAELAANYIEQPNIDPVIKSIIKRINRQAVNAIKRARESPSPDSGIHAVKNALSNHP